ncbi:MAG: class I SAM-dependent methyltransferase [Solirubrobacterales bacterium]
MLLRVKRIYWRQRKRALQRMGRWPEETPVISDPSVVQTAPLNSAATPPAREPTRRPREPAPPKLAEATIEELKSYILHREKALDRDLLRYGDPAGKNVLIFGGGYGNEVLWCIRRGATSIVSIDLTPVSSEPLERAMAQEQLVHDAYEFRTENIHETALQEMKFDLIISNGVFEHVMDLKGVLLAFRRLLKPRGRIAIFADGLWYSSIGGHIRGEPWEHLWRAPAEIKQLHPERWEYYCNHLNRMTIVDFLEAVRSVGMLVLQLNTGRDPNLTRLSEHLPAIRDQIDTVSPTDCSIVSVGCELTFPEHL